MARTDVLLMIKRRALAAGLPYSTSCHTFRATGITEYLKNGGTLEKAQTAANHESAKTTKLYDRRSDEISLDEIERITIEMADIAEPHATNSMTAQQCTLSKPGSPIRRRVNDDRTPASNPHDPSVAVDDTINARFLGTVWRLFIIDPYAQPRFLARAGYCALSYVGSPALLLQQRYSLLELSFFKPQPLELLRIGHDELYHRYKSYDRAQDA